jgi:hypothetical protein
MTPPIDPAKGARGRYPSVHRPVKGGPEDSGQGLHIVERERRRSSFFSTPNQNFVPQEDVVDPKTLNVVLAAERVILDRTATDEQIEAALRDVDALGKEDASEAIRGTLAHERRHRKYGPRGGGRQ